MLLFPKHVSMIVATGSQVASMSEIFNFLHLLLRFWNEIDAQYCYALCDTLPLQFRFMHTEILCTMFCICNCLHVSKCSVCSFSTFKIPRTVSAKACNYHCVSKHLMCSYIFCSRVCCSTSNPSNPHSKASLRYSNILVKTVNFPGDCSALLPVDRIGIYMDRFRKKQQQWL